MEKRVFIPFKNYEIPGVYSFPDNGEKFPAVLLLHGFMAYKEGDGHLFTKIAEGFKNNGIATLRIDFCSMGENRADRMNYGILRLTDEAREAYKAMQKNIKIIPYRIGICGHSFGGKVATEISDLNPKVIITLNGATSTNKKMKNVDNEECDKKGFTIVHTSDGRHELLYSKFFEDLQEDNSNTSISRYENPILIAYGANDPTVPPQIDIDFYNSLSNSNKKLLKIEDANHTFNAKTKDYTKVYELIDKLNIWLDQNLKEG